ncbi:hypothetical protein SK128_007002, partial [Halocaridina rubra]
QTCDDPCHCGCNYNARYICGTDDITYLNDCWFRHAVCNDPTLRKKHSGACR